MKWGFGKIEYASVRVCFISSVFSGTVKSLLFFAVMGVKSIIGDSELWFLCLIFFLNWCLARELVCSSFNNFCWNSYLFSSFRERWEIGKHFFFAGWDIKIVELILSEIRTPNFQVYKSNTLTTRPSRQGYSTALGTVRKGAAIICFPHKMKRLRLSLWAVLAGSSFYEERDLSSLFLVLCPIPQIIG